MLFKEFLFQNLYYFLALVALLSGLGTYLYFYNREVLSFSEEELVQLPKEEHPHLIVDLSGAVKNPGVYSLNPGDRVSDLLSFAGGVTNEVSEKWLSRNLNLSAILKDQQKIYVPFAWEIEPEEPAYTLATFPDFKQDGPGSGASQKDSANSSSDASSGSTPDSGSASDSTSTSNSGSASETSKINVNSATQKELEDLPRVGEVTAGKIIDNRPYANIEELQEKTGIYDSVVEQIKDLIIF